MEERGRGIADDDDGAGQAVAPELDGGGGTGGAEIASETGGYAGSLRVTTSSLPRGGCGR